MPLLLRVELGILVILILFLLIKIVNKNILKLNYALVWFFSLIAMIVAVLFPNLVDNLASFFNIKYTSNFLFLVGFVLLFLITFYLTLIVSKQSAKIKTIIQISAINNYENKKNKETKI
jgi:hypothetical protein